MFVIFFCPRFSLNFPVLFIRSEGLTLATSYVNLEHEFAGIRTRRRFCDDTYPSATKQIAAQLSLSILLK